MEYYSAGVRIVVCSSGLEPRRQLNASSDILLETVHMEQKHSKQARRGRCLNAYGRLSSCYSLACLL